jgi:phage FluMu gp28-like protein
MNEKIPVLRWSVEYSFLEKTVSARMKDADDWIAEHLAPVMADKSRLNPDLMTCFGQDFGRSGDLTVLWPMQLGAGMVRRTPFVIELRNVAFRQQEQILNYMVDRLPRFIAGAMDARGNGQQLAEAAQDRYGTRVEGVMLSIDWYRNNMPRYKAAFEDKTIELPKDPEILADNRAIKVDHTGVARIAEQPASATRVSLGGQRHGDSAIAAAMAYYASTMPKAEYAYTPAVPPSNSRFSSEDPTARDAYEDAKASGRGRRRLFGRGAW